jgi:hypothetical protein
MEIDTGERLNNLATLSKAIDVHAQNQQLTPLGRPTTTLEMVTAQRVVVPRNMPDIMGRVKTLSEMAGQEYYYSFPVKSKNKVTGEWETSAIEGPTIKLANDLAREYGNCGVETMVVDVGDSWVIYARFVDLERGFTMVRPFQQRKSQKSLKGDEARALDIALQIGVSKAIRNVIVNSLETFADYMFETAKEGLTKKISTDPQKWRDHLLGALSKIKVEPKRVERQIGRSVSAWTVKDIARVVSELKAVHEGMTSSGEIWPDQDFAGPVDDPDPVADESNQEKVATEPKQKMVEAKKVEKASDPKPDESEPENAISESLATCFSELTKMFTVDAINVLLDVTAEKLTSDEHAALTEAAIERKKTLQKKPPRG